MPSRSRKENRSSGVAGMEVERALTDLLRGNDQTGRHNQVVCGIFAAVAGASVPNPKFA